MYCCVNYYLFLVVYDGAGAAATVVVKGVQAIWKGKSTNFFRHTTAFQM